MISIHFLGPLRTASPSGDRIWKTEATGEPLTAILQRINIPQQPYAFTVFVNKERMDSNYIPVDGDEILLLPLLYAG